MATVVLLGCSTSGKTSAAQRVTKTHRDEFEIIDTDAVIARDSEFQGHLYAMYLKFVKDADTSAAHLYLEIGERHLLAQLKEKRESVLIAAGPNFSLRQPDWSLYLETVRPICFYFRLSAVQLYRGLKERRNRQRQRGLDLCPGFGCWDKGLATKFNPDTENWDELPEEEALPLIEKHLERVEPVYLSACEPQHVFDVAEIKHNRQLQDKITAALISCLRWTPLHSPSYEFDQSLSQKTEQKTSVPARLAQRALVDSL